jgi:hypothetical protein
MTVNDDERLGPGSLLFIGLCLLVIGVIVGGFGGWMINGEAHSNPEGWFYVVPGVASLIGAPVAIGLGVWRLAKKAFRPR